MNSYGADEPGSLQDANPVRMMRAPLACLEANAVRLDMFWIFGKPKHSRHFG